MIKHLVILLVGLGAAISCWAGPLEPTKSRHEKISPNRPLEQRLAFKGGERATVIVKGDFKSETDIFIEIRDAKGQLVTKDEAGGPLAAVIWHPPGDAVYQIKISVKGAETQTCYIVIR